MNPLGSGGERESILLDVPTVNCKVLAEYKSLHGGQEVVSAIRQGSATWSRLLRGGLSVQVQTGPLRAPEHSCLMLCGSVLVAV
jgi:hypothetical protein